jgi:CheY-like chemotaxis protein/HPt (histidine-containing phosphotransfer) domain-containing protein
MASEPTRNGAEEERSGTSPLDAFEARMAALHAKMVQGLPARGTELEDAAQRLAAGASGARDELRRLAHKLRGIAGSQGFGRCGELAGALEATAKDTDRSDAEVTALARELACAARDAAAGTQSEAAPTATAPTATAPTATAPRVERAERPALAPVPELAGLVFLAADDDGATRKLIEITLLQLGRMRGALFDRGMGLLEELAQREHIDLVIVDAMMPSMSGLQLLEEVRARGLAGRVKRFVVLSAAAPEELGWTLPEGLDVRWARKPFRPRELLAALLTVMRDA